MTKGRLEAFSDGVFAIIITITVLDLHVPRGSTYSAIRPLLPIGLTYVLSFVYVGIYWNNHHHLLQATDHISGRVLWANLHLLFWLSLVPFATSWMGENHMAPLPVAAYGFMLLMAAVAYYILVKTLLAAHGPNSRLRRSIGRDTKGIVSIVIYMAAIPLAFASPRLAAAGYVAVAMMWLVPDRRIESKGFDRDDA